MLIQLASMTVQYGFIENLDEVLERLGGNPLLLDKLLIKFRDTYRDTRTTLGRLIEEQRIEEAHRLVHSIKGVAGNLGLIDIYRLSAQLDAQLKNSSSVPDDLDVSDFLASMDAVIIEVDRLKT